MPQWIRSALVQIMACRLFGTKPLSRPMLGYYEMDPWAQTSVKLYIKIQKISLTKMHVKVSSAKWRPFCPGGDELITHCPRQIWQLFQKCKFQTQFGDHILNIQVNFAMKARAWEDLVDGKLILVQIIAWCRQAPSHYLNKCWPRSLIPYH